MSFSKLGEENLEKVVYTFPDGEVNVLEALIPIPC